MLSIEIQPRFKHGATRSNGFAAAFVGELHIVPARKEIFLVPGTFTMAQDHKCSSHVFQTTSPSGRLLSAMPADFDDDDLEDDLDEFEDEFDNEVLLTY